MLEIRKKTDTSNAWSKAEYNAIYAGPRIRLTDSLYTWLVNLLKLQSGRRLLDISCGEGRVAHFATQAGVSAIGLDLSEIALRTAISETGRKDFVVGDAQQLPFSANAFDYVANIGSLEHYLKPAQGAAEMARVLRPGGVACVLLPNIYSLLDNVWYAFRFGRTFEDNQPIQRYAARYEWQDLLEGNGLRVVQTIKYQREWPTNWADIHHYLQRPKALVRLVATPFVPLNLASCFVFLCDKR